MERETGIEPVSLAWKAKVLPLNYSRTKQIHKPWRQNFQAGLIPVCDLKQCAFTRFAGGGDWIRTSVGVSQQIYSLPPLATRAPPREPQIIT